MTLTSSPCYLPHQSSLSTHRSQSPLQPSHPLTIIQLQRRASVPSTLQCATFLWAFRPNRGQVPQHGSAWQFCSSNCWSAEQSVKEKVDRISFSSFPFLEFAIMNDDDQPHIGWCRREGENTKELLPPPLAASFSSVSRRSGDWLAVSDVSCFPIKMRRRTGRHSVPTSAEVFGGEVIESDFDSEL